MKIIGKKAISVILCLLMITGMFGMVSFAADEVPDGYTGIYDIEDLYMIRNDLDGNYILMNDIDLTADLADGGDWNEGCGWTAIGITSTGCDEFTGIFDGNNHTLTGFRINLTSINSGYTGTYYAGLFGSNSGTIKNIVMKSATIYQLGVRAYVGTIAGSNSGIIYNCSVDVKCTLNTNNSSGTRYLGGIVGYNSNRVSMCDVTGTFKINTIVYDTTLLNYGGYNCVGNVVGYSDKDSVIELCMSNADNSIGARYLYTSMYVGGIVGYAKGTVASSGHIGSSIMTAGSTYSKSGNSYYCDVYYGGIGGMIEEAQTINCYSDDNIQYYLKNGTLSRYPYIGGIAGGFASDNTVNCVYAVGTISKINGGGTSEYVGGIAGMGGSVTAASAYYNSSNNVGTGGSSTDVYTAKSSTIMTKQAAYTGFDFDNIWIMYPCSGYKYPQIRSNPMDSSSYDHTCQNPISSAEATCTTDGYIRGFCDNCGEEYTKVLPALGHDFAEEYTIDKEADCENSGLKSQHCSRCDATQNETVISALGHNFSAWETVTESTGCKEGAMQRTCATCGKVETKTYSAVDHTIVTDIAVEPTCTETGLTEGSHCSACGKIIVAQEEIPAKGHIAVEDTAAVAPTCTETGKTASTKCSVCGEVITEAAEVPATGHNYTSAITKQATCTEAGVRTYTCSDCGDVYTETISATGHSFGNWTVTVAATTTSEGLQERTCSVCGYKETQSMAKLPVTNTTTVSIRNMSKYNGKTVDYKTTITFYADVVNSTGANVEWHVTGANKTLNSDGSCTIKQATGNFTVYCTTKDSNGNEVRSEIEAVNVKTDFFARIVAFFRGIFGKLPVYDQ